MLEVEGGQFACAFRSQRKRRRLIASKRLGTVRRRIKQSNIKSRHALRHDMVGWDSAAILNAIDQQLLVQGEVERLPHVEIVEWRDFHIEAEIVVSRVGTLWKSACPRANEY